MPASTTRARRRCTRRCAELKQLGTTVVMIAHRPSILGLADKLLVLRNGMVDVYGNARRRDGAPQLQRRRPPPRRGGAGTNSRAAEQTA